MNGQWREQVVKQAMTRSKPGTPVTQTVADIEPTRNPVRRTIRPDLTGIARKERREWVVL